MIRTNARRNVKPTLPNVGTQNKRRNWKEPGRRDVSFEYNNVVILVNHALTVTLFVFILLLNIINLLLLEISFWARGMDLVY